MSTDDSGKTPHNGPKLPFVGMLPDHPPSGEGKRRIPLPPKVSGRVSTPPPPPKEAVKRTLTPPPLPVNDFEDEEAAEPTNPRIKFTKEQQKLIAMVKAMHGNEPRFEHNGNGYLALISHVKDMGDKTYRYTDAHSRILFILPVKYVAIAATALALGSAGAAAYLWCSKAELEKKVEAQEKALEQIKKQLKTQQEKKNQKVSSYIPKKLRNPPQKPKLKVISKRPLRRFA